MRVIPSSTDTLTAHLVGLICRRAYAGTLRVAIDGAPVAAPSELADALVAPLRAAGRPAIRVRADDFLRPASVRFEHGRTDPDAWYEDRLDVAGLSREVLAPFGAGPPAVYLTSLWDPVRDRATRAGYLPVPDRGVLLLDGSLLLGVGLDLDLTVHLAQRADTLLRRTPPDERWLLPAFERYRREVDPEAAADLVVRLDDPRHPAIVADR